jgi:hypothetical protein
VEPKIFIGAGCRTGVGVGVGAEFGNTVVAGVTGYEFGFAPGVEKGGGGGLGGCGGLGGEKGRAIAPGRYCEAGTEFGFVFGKYPPRRLFDVPNVPNGVSTGDVWGRVLSIECMVRRLNIILYLY